MSSPPSSPIRVASASRKSRVVTYLAISMIAGGFVVYIVGSYLGVCDFPASQSHCLNELSVLAQPFWASAFGNMYAGGYFAPFAYAIVGLVLVIFGAVALVANLLRSRVVLPLSGNLMALSGWLLVAGGLSVTVGAAAESYICAEYCFNVNDSFVRFWGGIIAAEFGVVLLAAVLLTSRLKHPEHERLARWGLAAVMVAMMAVTLWTAVMVKSAYDYDNNFRNFGFAPAYVAGMILQRANCPAQQSTGCRSPT